MTLGQALIAEMRSTTEYVPVPETTGSTSWTETSSFVRSGDYAIGKSGRPKHGGIINPGAEVVVRSVANLGSIWGDSWPLVGWREDPGTPGDWAICVAVRWDAETHRLGLWADDTGPWGGAANLVEVAAMSSLQTPLHRARSWIDTSVYFKYSTPVISLYFDGIQYLTWNGGGPGWAEQVDVWDMWTVPSNTSIGFNQMYMDDFFAETVTGDQAGKSRRYFIALPDGAGASTQWTPDAGSNYARVNEVTAPDGDTSYVDTAAAAQKDLYTFDDLTEPIANYDIAEVYMQSEFENVDDGEVTQANYDHVVDDGALESTDGPFSNAVLDTYVGYLAWSAFPLQPDGSAWSIADFNSWEYGVETN